jgi:ribosomal protein L29
VTPVYIVISRKWTAEGDKAAMRVLDNPAEILPVRKKIAAVKATVSK